MSSTTTFLLMVAVFVVGLGVYFSVYQFSDRMVAMDSAPAPQAQDGTQSAPSAVPSQSRRVDRPYAVPDGPFAQARVVFRQAIRALVDMGLSREVARIIVIAVLLAIGFFIASIAVRILSVVFSGPASFFGGLLKVILVPAWQLVLAAISIGDSFEFVEGQLGSNAAIAFVALSLVIMFYLSRGHGQRA